MKKVLTILILISINLYSLTKNEEDFLYASSMGDIKTVRKLLSLGMDVNIQNEDGWTALMYASLFGYIEIVKELIKAGVDINIKDRYGDTALDWAKDEGHNDIVEILSK